MQTEGIDEANPWTVIREEEKYDCPHLTARRDIVSFSGRASLRQHSRQCHGVCVAPIDNRGYVTWSANSDTCKGATLGSYPEVVGRRDDLPTDLRDLLAQA